jgi:hypothetical protein
MGGGEAVKVITKTDAQHCMVQRDIGNIGLTTPSTTRLDTQCMARSDTPPWHNGIAGNPYVWDYIADPHGTNIGGTTVVSSYGYDHQTASATMAAGDCPFYDPSCGGYGVRDSTRSVLGNPNRYENLAPTFASVNGIAAFNEIAQDHPNFAQANAPATEQKWFIDSRPMGGGGNQLNDAATLVSGQLYKYISRTSDGDNLNCAGGNPTACDGGSSSALNSISRKLQATMAFCGSQPLVDISQAVLGNVINTDSTSAYEYCIARKAGECRTGSTRGDIYFNCPYVKPRADTTLGCNNVANENGLMNDPCFNNTGAYLNGMDQIGFQRTDSAGAVGRILNYGFMRYRVNNVNENTRTTPDGLRFMVESLGMYGTEYSIISGKMVSYPKEDSIARNNYQAVQLNITAPGGTNNVTVTFGLAEYETEGSPLCTSRQELCLANATTLQNPPFQFPSEGSDGTQATISGVPCTTTCSVVIPALPGRVIYYQVNYRNSSNVVTAQSAVGVLVAP